ncbi:ABC transporter permease [Deinococcus multiflagellatus]|uniref:ABC transporter permease subunit n=1 Tax=Deinococcus multiflagellatus TaxID=1656887 RepID=A0ABW1ZGR2_9DEIO|nr:ABC transporter permease [Deinococcus multiflagellatus]MBZ9712081.1 ABC transporter permease [Deinococcus multiflagellatus]
MRAKGLRPALVWQVATRDLLATVRDRRTLNATILMPLILIPLLTLGLPLLMGQLVGGQQQERQKVGVSGTLPPALRAALERDDTLPDGTVVRAGVRLQPVADPVAAVQSGEVDAALRPVGALPLRAGDGTGTLELHAKLGNLRAQTGAYSKVSEVVEAYNRGLAVQRLQGLGLGEQVLRAVTLKPVDASTPQEQRSGQLAFLIPMLMLQFILSGAMATALDATAGEKERGTLESLLVSPVRRAEVVAGKLLATTLTALTSAAFSVIGFVLSGLAMRLWLQGQPEQQAVMTQGLGGQLSLSLGSTLTLLGVALSAALLVSALLISVGIFARSFKEAQTYVAPITLFVVLPAILLQFADFLQIGLGAYAIPVVGGMIAILDAVRGAPDAAHVLLAMAVNLLGAGLLAAFALRSFGREEVIFRN